MSGRNTFVGRNINPYLESAAKSGRITWALFLTRSCADNFMLAPSRPIEQRHIIAVPGSPEWRFFKSKG